jgi:hypothetical protein
MNRRLPPTLRRTINQRAHLLALQFEKTTREKWIAECAAAIKAGEAPSALLQRIAALSTQVPQ